MKRSLIIILVLLSIGAIVTYFVMKNSINTKAKAIDIISDYTKVAKSGYESFDESYLIARAKAIKSGSETFTDQDTTYYTKTGKRV